MCDLGFLVYDHGFGVGFWMIFERVIGSRRRGFFLGFLGFLEVVLVGDPKGFMEGFLG